MIATKTKTVKVGLDVGPGTKKLDSVSKNRKSSVARSISDLDRSFAASVVGDQLIFFATCVRLSC